MDQTAALFELPDFFVPYSRRGKQAADDGFFLLPAQKKIGKTRYGISVGRGKDHQKQDRIHIFIFQDSSYDPPDRGGVVPCGPHIHRVRPQGQGGEKLVDQPLCLRMKDSDFKTLSSQKKTISIILTILELVLYFGFISLIAFNKPFLAQKFSGAITVGIPIAVGTIVLSWVLTGIYIRWANTKYDVLVKKVREKIGG